MCQKMRLKISSSNLPQQSCGSGFGVRGTCCCFHPLGCLPSMPWPPQSGPGFRRCWKTAPGLKEKGLAVLSKKNKDEQANDNGRDMSEQYETDMIQQSSESSGWYNCALTPSFAQEFTRYSSILTYVFCDGGAQNIHIHKTSTSDNVLSCIQQLMNHVLPSISDYKHRNVFFSNTHANRPTSNPCYNHANRFVICDLLHAVWSYVRNINLSVYTLKLILARAPSEHTTADQKGDESVATPFGVAGTSW